MVINKSNYFDGFKAVINITEEYNNLMHFAGVYDTQCSNIKFIACYNDYVYESEVSKSVFDFHIPFADSGNIDFFVQNEGGELSPANVSYAFPAKINDLSHSFFIGDNTLTTRMENGNSLYVETIEHAKLCSAVNLYIGANFSDEKYKEDREIIQEYLAQYKIMSKKKIWLITDRRDRADDNGEYLFKYAVKMDDGIEKYFVVEENSPDAERISKIGNVVYFGSAENKLLCLFAEKFISSHLNTRLCDYRHWNKNEYVLYAGLDRAKTVFLQHGVIIHEISGWLKRLNQNIKLFVTSSAYEYNEVLGENYGYDKSVVKLTGMPRYDSIYDDNKQKILFAPTWRGSVFNIPKNELLESGYYKAICRFLSDKKFIDKLKEQGYDLSFKPHPMLASIASDFEVDEYVEIVPYNVSYQTLFAESSLLITDFSSTAFDFAYLKKPVIYYHFFENHMGKGYFDYNEMGFGEVTADYNELINMIIEYMSRDCVMEDKYKQRVDNFFEHFDKNNTRRVYNEIINI